MRILGQNGANQIASFLNATLGILWSNNVGSRDCHPERSEGSAAPRLFGVLQRSSLARVAQARGPPTRAAFARGGAEVSSPVHL